MTEEKKIKIGVGDAVASIAAITVALVFIFPIYWSFSQSLRNPIDTFTVAGFGIPWINFTPTLDNWIDQLGTPETAKALANSTVIAVSAALLALVASTAVHAKDISLLNVSYDPTRELYVDYNKAFSAYWKGKTGDTVTVRQSHGGSGLSLPPRSLVRKAL